MLRVAYFIDQAQFKIRGSMGPASDFDVYAPVGRVIQHSGSLIGATWSGACETLDHFVMILVQQIPAKRPPDQPLNETVQWHLGQKAGL